MTNYETSDSKIFPLKYLIGRNIIPLPFLNRNNFFRMIVQRIRLNFQLFLMSSLDAR